MKIKFPLLLLFVFTLSSITFAQSVIITSKKITYKRPKPEMDYKKTFTINYPKVKAANARLSQKIETTISYEKNLSLDLKEEMGEIQWLEEADYTVDYNKNGVLSIELFITGSGAYPSSSNKNVVVNLKTGNRVRPIEVFKNLNGLITKIRAMQKDEIIEAIKVIKEDPDYNDLNTDELFQNKDFKVADFEGFLLNDKGVTFVYNYGFRHAILALQPNGTYYFTWAELKPFIKPAGLLGRFIR
jgi:hypothetical protein